MRKSRKIATGYFRTGQGNGSLEYEDIRQLPRL
jgi:hypothetical protein